MQLKFLINISKLLLDGAPMTVAPGSGLRIYPRLLRFSGVKTASPHIASIFGV